MFKNLKEKVGKRIVEETQRIQTTVSTVGANIATQIRERSEVDSDRASVTSGDEPMRVPPTQSSAPQLAINDNSVTGSSSFMDGFSIDDDLELSPSSVHRQRRASSSSVMSGVDDRALFDQWQPLSRAQLEPIASDVESTYTGDNVVAAGGNASKEQLSNVLHKLQGRAATYKDRYAQLAKAYNEVVRENDKCKAVLAETQDKALARIEKLRNNRADLQRRLSDALQSAEVEKNKTNKLEELLARCKEAMRVYKADNDRLKADNERLTSELNNSKQDQDGEAGMSALAIERVAAEWRERLATAERAAEERATMAVAQAKQTAHEQMEAKDAQVQALMQQKRASEICAAQANEQFMQQLAAARAAADALESEKKELFNELTKIKQDAVVKSDEETKRHLLENEQRERQAERDAEWQRRIDALIAAHNKQLDTVERECARRVREADEQAQLAVEEREMQKAAALVRNDERIDEAHAQVERLNTENMQLQSKLHTHEQKLNAINEQHNQLVQRMTEQHGSQLDQFKQEHDTILTNLKQQNALAEKQRGELESEVKSLQALVDTLKTEMTLRDEAIEKREAVERQIVQTTMASPPVAVDLPDTEALVAAERERLQSVHELAIAELTDKLAATEQLVSKKAQIVKTLTSEVEMLKESMKHLMDIKQEAEQQRDASANDKLNSLAVMQEQLADAERATSEWSERVRSTDKMLEQAQLVAEEQRTLMFNYESQIELLKTEILNTTAAQQEHESGELRSLRQELNDKSKECEALTAQVATKARLLSTNEESCAVIENELKTAEQTLASVRAQLRERDEQLAALQTVHAQLQIQYSAMEDALSSNDETSAELRDVRKRLTDVEHEYELARDALRTATEQQRVSEQVTTRLQQQLEEGAREQQDLAALREQLSLSEQREQEARDIADECRQTTSTAHARLADVEERCRVKDEKLAVFSERVAVAERSVVAADAEKATLHKQLSELRERLDEEQQNVAKLIGELADQMRASEELSRTTQTVRSLEKHLHELEAEVASARSTAESLQAQLHDSRAALTAAGVKQRALEEDALVQAADVERRLGAVREQLELEHAHAIGKLNDRIETLTQSAAAEHDGVRERCEQLALENGALRAAVDNATQEQEARTEQLVKELETHYADKETQWQKEIDDAYAKLEVDRQKLGKDYQRELKQLYKDLNDRTQKYESLKASYQEQLKAKDAELIAVAGEPSAVALAVSPLNAEIDRLKQQLEDVEAKHDREMRLLTMRNGVTAPAGGGGRLHSVDLSSMSPGGGGDESLGALIEPTEAEYLRNVLYRYMIERESLGRESIALARVIARALRFPSDQAHRIVAKEESRQQSTYTSWMPAALTTHHHS